MHHVLGDAFAQLDVFSHIVTDESGEVYKPPKFQRRRTHSVPQNVCVRLSMFMIDVVKTVWLYTYSLLHVLSVALWRDSKTKLNPQLSQMSGVFSLNISRPMSLEFIKQIKNHATLSLQENGPMTHTHTPTATPRVTVNDVMMCALAGAVRRYCSLQSTEDHPLSVDDLSQRILLPFAFPRPRGEMHNFW